jgi:prepilin peptidase dependent protein D
MIGPTSKVPATSQQGFSLIELLIVITIIALLSSIAIGSYLAYKQRAAAANADSTLSSCTSELGAQYADSAQQTFTCTVGGSAPVLTIDTTTGAITGGTGSYVVNGQTVNCTLSNNVITCT